MIPPVYLDTLMTTWEARDRLYARYAVRVSPAAVAAVRVWRAVEAAGITGPGRAVAGDIARLWTPPEPDR